MEISPLPSPALAHPASLRLRPVLIDTWGENVAYVARTCTAVRAEGFKALSKVEIRRHERNGDTPILAVLNIVDDASIVADDELGLSEQAFAQLALEPGTRVDLTHAQRPPSLDAVRRKIVGERLDGAAFQAIVRDIAANRYSRTEIAAFLVACSQNELERDEILALTRAMLDTGERLDWHETVVADKHCIGGIPGNRTSMLVVPIVAAHGMLIPKTSSRAITSPAGTADTMEVLAQVELAPERLREIVVRERGCLAWGGTTRLAPVDDILISVERPLGIDSIGQMVASILSKKLAAGSTHLLLDIPVGPSAKVRSMREAQRLRKTFEFVGASLGMHIEVVITDGRQPIGRGIGPVLEARDVMAVLRNEPDAPADLRMKAIRLAGRILEFDPDVRGGDGEALARDIVESGRALSKMESLIDRQGRRLEPPPLGRHHCEIVAPVAGIVEAIDNLRLARAARYAGAPQSAGAGLDLLARIGDTVAAGAPLYRLYADYPSEFDFARRWCESDSGYRIGSGTTAAAR
jgi:thymidine phosphorylase